MSIVNRRNAVVGFLAIKEAGLVALGRAIHIPNRKPRAATPA